MVTDALFFVCNVLYTGWHIKSGAFHFVAYVYTTRTENFYNMSTVPKTLVKMLTLCCKN